MEMPTGMIHMSRQISTNIMFDTKCQHAVFPVRKGCTKAQPNTILKSPGRQSQALPGRNRKLENVNVFS